MTELRRNSLTLFALIAASLLGIWSACPAGAAASAGEPTRAGGLRVGAEWLPFAQSSGRRLDLHGAVVRGVRANGSLDRSFAQNGVLSLPHAVNEYGFIVPADIVVLPDDRFAVASGDALRLFRADGSVDASFGASGERAVDGVAVGVELRSDGRLFVASNSPAGVVITVVDVAGTVDSSFADQGKLLIPGDVEFATMVPGSSSLAVVTSVTRTASSQVHFVAGNGTVSARTEQLRISSPHVQFASNGDVLLAGTVFEQAASPSTGADSQWAALMRVGSDGRLIASATVDGDWGYDATELPDGRIVFLGSRNVATFGAHFTARFSAQLGRDQRYGTRGFAYLPQFSMAALGAMPGSLRSSSGGDVEVLVASCRARGCTIPPQCSSPALCAVVGRMVVDGAGAPTLATPPYLRAAWRFPSVGAALGGSVIVDWTIPRAQPRTLVAVFNGKSWGKPVFGAHRSTKPLRVGVTCLRVEVLDRTLRSRSAQRCVGRPYGSAIFERSAGWHARRDATAYLRSTLIATRRGATMQVRNPDSGRLLHLVARTCRGCGQIQVRAGSGAWRAISLDTPAITDNALVTVPLPRGGADITIRAAKLGAGVAVRGAVVTCGLLKQCEATT